jgi:CRP/FNR family transcriptional regulator, cyclic AMP receptor protein
MQVISVSRMSHDISGNGGRTNAHTGAGFSTLTGAELEHFQSIAHDVTHPGRSMIFREGDSNRGIYLLCEGQVKLMTESDERRRIILNIAMPGDMLGLSAVLNNLPYEVTAETLVPCTLKHVEQEVFLNFIRSSTEAVHATALALAREYRELFLSARRLALSSSASARIALVLMDFLRSDARHESIPTFHLTLTHAELASLAGTSRETVTRLLNQFERDGVISRSNSIVTVVQLERLEQLAN